MRPLWNEHYQPEDAEIVKRIARKFARRNPSPVLDVDEVEQELAMHVVKQSHLHDPSRGTRAQFISKIAKHRVLNMIEWRDARKRNDRRNVSSEVVGEHLMADSDDAFAQIDAAMDVEAVKKDLPQDLRAVAALWPEYTPREIEQKLGLSRAAVRWRIQQIEQIFRDRIGDDFKDE
jgi:RNA polymerase sigma factor (sigma-70 family)